MTTFFPSLLLSRHDTLLIDFPDPLNALETILVKLMSLMKGMLFLSGRMDGIEAAIRYTPGSTVVQVIVAIQLYVGSA
jgi:hypothetical protein